MDDQKRRDININQGNYNESIEGNYIQGNLTINEIAKVKKKNLTSVQIYKIIEESLKEKYVGYAKEHLIPDNILLLCNQHQDIYILLSAIYIEQKRNIYLKTRRYHFCENSN